jgi:hypothetical protein
MWFNPVVQEKAQGERTLLWIQPSATSKQVTNKSNKCEMSKWLQEYALKQH